jgi:tRNA A37 N6-isopentenylltransferase MiaA
VLWTIGLIKQHTRNYAKRQMTWLRRGTWNLLDPQLASPQRIEQLFAP